MNILIDILTPKQCMLFQRVSERLEERGHRVLMVSRGYREVNQIIMMKGIDAVAVGRHGGKNLKDKLVESAKRIAKLTPIFSDFEPDVAVSFSSPETARVSYGLGVPHINISDSPHAVAVSKLTLPLSSKLLTPKMIPKRSWIKYGIPPEDIVQYNALDPWAWLKDFKPEIDVLFELGIDETRPLMTIRSPEIFAAYLLGNPENESVIGDFVNRFLGLYDDLQIVMIPRYSEQLESYKNAYCGKIIVPRSVIDGPSLLYYSDVFIGAGGTMSAEAALLGVPTISCYPGESYLIERYMVEMGLIERETNLEKLVEKVKKILDNPGVERRRHEEIVNQVIESYEDPVDVIVAEIEKT